MFDQLLEYYRRFYWAANALLLVAIAYVLAGFVVRTAFERFVPMPAPRSAAAQPVQTAARPPSFNEYRVILQRNLFQIKAEDAPVVAEALPEDLLDEEPVQTTLQASLIGTVAGNAQTSYSVVQAGGSTDVYKIGDVIQGSAEVLEIHRGSITILNNGRREVLSMYDEDQAPRRAPSRRPPPRRERAAMPMPEPGGDAEVDIDVREVGDGQFEIPREQFEEMTANLGPLLTQARVVPNFQDGKIDGYKIFAIKPGSLYEQIGVQNGDVIHRINGVEIDSPEKALQLFQSLRTERRFEINLSRNDQPMTFNYNLR